MLYIIFHYKITLGDLLNERLSLVKKIYSLIKNG